MIERLTWKLLLQWTFSLFFFFFFHYLHLHVFPMLCFYFLVLLEDRVKKKRRTSSDCRIWIAARKKHPSGKHTLQCLCQSAFSLTSYNFCSVKFSVFRQRLWFPNSLRAQQEGRKTLFVCFSTLFVCFMLLK